MIVPAILLAALWVGHACFWTYWLNNLYGRPLSKRFLKPWRLLTGIVIASAPLLLLSAVRLDFVSEDWQPINGLWGGMVVAYSVAVCAPLGIVVFPAVTLYRLLRPRPRALREVTTRTLDLWPKLGEKLIGDGHWAGLARLPGNDIFRVDFTDLTLTPRELPAAWDGLSILLLSDLHFHGTPSREFFQRVTDEIANQPHADIVALAGDFVDTDWHHEWIGPLLGQLKWREHGLAILGNHDKYHDPDRVREELSKAGYRMLSRQSEVIPIRGLPCRVIGHEGPWFPPPDEPEPKTGDAFYLCLSHSPDNFYWGQERKINLMLCGHVHGGQVRLPVIGSIFVPSVYSRRFDQGVFEQNGTVMVVGRGLSGKEPLRFRCRPQVIRITLKSQPTQET
ncbi:metallophosphoesterase [Limnoglobus roseus]|uniref:Phosphoesterase ykuE n=1 Tax=Limnoglobus roseus TaxID=2598579 RepID=A0A5C1AMU1_9BACT|nr:metallophosphoesterase [Limnoglobus roseus]QEL18228.1 phosphoesterase ykuE [Limnoglobus roseus]